MGNTKVYGAEVRRCEPNEAEWLITVPDDCPIGVIRQKTEGSRPVQAWSYFADYPYLGSFDGWLAACQAIQNAYNFFIEDHTGR